MKNLFRILLFLNFITLGLAANAKEYSTAKCNIEKYKSVIEDLLKNNDEHAQTDDQFNASVGSHDSQYLQSNVFAGLTSMSQRFYAANPRSGKSIDGSIVFNVNIEDGEIKRCTLKAILLD